MFTSSLWGGLLFDRFGNRRDFAIGAGQRPVIFNDQNGDVCVGIALEFRGRAWRQQRRVNLCRLELDLRFRAARQ